MHLEPFGVLGVVRLHRERLGPEIGRQVLIGSLKGLIGGLEEVLAGTRMAGRLSVAVLNASECDHFLGDGSANDASTSRGRHKLDTD